MSANLLEVRDVRHAYGSHPALAGVSLSVPRGELFGLLGPNGAGKTTLLSILSGLLKPTSGSVRVDGVDVRPDDPAGRRLIGLVPQELAVYGELTARENLTFFGKLYGLAGAELARRVDALLDAVALTDRANDRVSAYSGGMKRRLNLGVALLHDPPLILLDEPTTGVDPQSRHHIFEEVRRRNAAGTTVIYTSHYMEEVQSLCTRVGIIDRGKLIACDDLTALLHRLPGRIALRVDRPGDLAARLAALPGVTVQANGPDLKLECGDVPGTLLKMLPVLQDLGVTPAALETQEPNLERVFLHLTGHGLRD